MMNNDVANFFPLIVWISRRLFLFFLLSELQSFRWQGFTRKIRFLILCERKIFQRESQGRTLHEKMALQVILQRKET